MYLEVCGVGSQNLDGYSRQWATGDGTCVADCQVHPACIAARASESRPNCTRRSSRALRRCAAGQDGKADKDQASWSCSGPFRWRPQNRSPAPHGLFEASHHERWGGGGARTDRPAEAAKRPSGADCGPFWGPSRGSFGPSAAPGARARYRYSARRGPTRAASPSAFELGLPAAASAGPRPHPRAPGPVGCTIAGPGSMAQAFEVREELAALASVHARPNLA
eukprot:scaffold2799_cov408-Prasinococcus_capsulatus_cf.AAC.8